MQGERVQRLWESRWASPRCVGITQSVMGMKRTKKWRKVGFTLHLYAELNIDLLVPEVFPVLRL